MKKTIKLISVASLSSFLLIFSMNVNAKIYKWTDANGQTHYTAQPPAQTKQGIKAKNIEDQIKAYAGKYRPPAKTAAKNTDDNSESNSDEKLAGPDEKLVKYCKSQRNNLKQLKKNFRNVWIDIKGKKTNLNQEQRKEKVIALQDQIKENCSEVKPS